MMTYVYVGGTFDMFHYGHARFLRKCREHGKVLVALNTDEFASRYKRKPIMSLEERIESVKACRWADEVVVNTGDENTGATIESMPEKKFVYIAHGSDWTGEGLLKQLGISQGWLDKMGIQMLYIDYTDGVSSSDIIKRVNANVQCNCNCSCGRACNEENSGNASAADKTAK